MFYCFNKAQQNVLERKTESLYGMEAVLLEPSRYLQILTVQTIYKYLRNRRSQKKSLKTKNVGIERASER